MGELASSSSSNASTKYVTVYTSHHWGDYPRLVIWAHERYYRCSSTTWTFGCYGGSSTSPTSSEFTKQGTVSSTSKTLDHTVSDETEVVEYTVHFKRDSMDDIQVSKALIMTIGSGSGDAYIQEYAIMYSNSRLCTLEASIVDNKIKLEADDIAYVLHYTLSRKTIKRA